MLFVPKNLSRYSLPAVTVCTIYVASVSKVRYA